MDRALHRRLFGQHFLKDDIVCQKIVDNFLKHSEGALKIIEIGPGQGALTRLLKGPVTLIEKDRFIAGEWKKVADKTVIEDDAARINYSEILVPSTAVLSNLPYSSGTAILIALSYFPDRIQHMTLMFQKEVADRLTALPGEKKFNSLTVFIQNQWEIESFLLVKPGSFAPPPKVDSRVVSMRPRNIPLITSDLKALDKLLNLAFSQKRKMLRSLLGKGSVALQALEAVGIDPTRRAETLSFAEWKKWFDQLSSSSF